MLHLFANKNNILKEKKETAGFQILIETSTLNHQFKLTCFILCCGGQQALSLCCDSEYSN